MSAGDERGRGVEEALAALEGRGKRGAGERRGRGSCFGGSGLKRFSWSGLETSLKRRSVLFRRAAGEDRHGNDWDVRASWYKRGSAVIMMGWRRGYAVILGEEGEDGSEVTERREWWDILLVGFGGISNLYVPVGDFSELDLRASSLPPGHRMGVILEEGVELVEFQ